MPLTQNSLNNGARWEVRWQGKRGIVSKQFEEDFASALELYVKLKTHERRTVTLRCCNVGFPPPDRIVAHERVTWQRVTRNGRVRKKKVIEVVDLMERYNDRGVMWCPYCVCLRRYRLLTQGRRIVMVCPVCEVTSLNFHVLRWNPKAKNLEFRQVRRKRVRPSGR